MFLRGEEFSDRWGASYAFHEIPLYSALCERKITLLVTLRRRSFACAKRQYTNFSRIYSKYLVLRRAKFILPIKSSKTKPKEMGFKIYNLFWPSNFVKCEISVRSQFRKTPISMETLKETTVAENYHPCESTICMVYSHSQLLEHNCFPAFFRTAKHLFSRKHWLI